MAAFRDGQLDALWTLHRGLVLTALGGAEVPLHRAGCTSNVGLT